jgi:hypothetical protein
MPDPQRKPSRRKHSQLQTKRTGWKAWANSKVVAGVATAVVSGAAGSATTWELDHLGSVAVSAICTTVDTRKGPSTTIQKLYCKSSNGKITISPEP